MKILNFFLMGLAVLSVVACSSQQVGTSSEPSSAANAEQSQLGQFEKAAGAMQAVTTPKNQTTSSASTMATQDFIPVQLNGKWGFADKTGKTVIQPQYTSVGLFSEGLAAVKIDSKWGYINPKGKMVIKPQFNDALPFAQGLAAVQLGQNSGYIDRGGKFVIHAQVDHNLNFSGIAVEQRGKSLNVVSNGAKKR